MDNYVGLTSYNALGRGGQSIAERAGTLRSRLNALISALEPAREAMQGAQLAEFERAKYELTSRFRELTRWAERNAEKLGESQSVVNTADQTSQAQLASAGGALGSLTRPIV
jgi:uncharacterized protein YukE